MKNSRSDILRIVLLPIFESASFFGAFWLAYQLRTIKDWIPFVQLRTPYISEEQFWPFVLVWVAVWLFVFVCAKLYSHVRFPLFAEIKRVITYSFIWFLVYIGIVYLTQWFIFFKEIPRLIIFYTLFLWIFFSILIRTGFHAIWKYFSKKNIFSKPKILVIRENENQKLPFALDLGEASYEITSIHQSNQIEDFIRSGNIDVIMMVSSDFGNPAVQPILSLAKTYGITCVHPRIMPYMKHFSQTEDFFAGIPVVSLSSISIMPWERVLKRIIDIILSIIFIILSLPLMIIAAIGIYLEDNSGPIVYRNRRIGQNGKLFTLYKFRYMYWKYCTKEDYLKDGEKDDAIEFEENLKKSTDNSRSGPLYKIQNDPRKMRFWKIIEKFSIDELPQLFNVLLGNMSIVGPRPHQPREVALYDETDKQVLTIKPGITGMAQVYGRDKNTFKEEIAHDIYYIENYSILLDFLIIFRTILVVLRRPFEKK